MTTEKSIPRLETTGGDAMWIPIDADELERVVTSKSLNETSTLKSKRQLPSSLDLAKDVAAMANDGGVLIIGVAEDSEKLPTILAPLVLRGAAERISSIIRSALSEPPVFSIKELPKAGGPTEGYIAIIVPASPR